MTGSRLGAYGLALDGVPAAAAMLVEAPAGWQRWSVSHRPPATAKDDGLDFLSPSYAWMQLGGGGRAAIIRPDARTVLVMQSRPRDAEIVHPFLSLTAAVAARWRRDDCFHAGGIVIDGRVWGLLGEKGRGKSSTVAQLALSGVPVMSDDVLVVSRRRALAGPRSIDLREDVAEHFGAGDPLGVVGARARWRLPLGPVEAELPVGGWVALEWGDEIAVEPVLPSERFRLLASNLCLRVPPPDLGSLLDLAELPAVRLRRPRRLETLDDACQRLHEAIARSPALV